MGIRVCPGVRWCIHQRADPTEAGYEQRAYSAVVEVTPEARRQGLDVPLSTSITDRSRRRESHVGNRAVRIHIAQRRARCFGARVPARQWSGRRAGTSVARARGGGVTRASDLAFAPDGSIFVAERAGTVRLVRNGVPVETPALDVSSEVSEPGGGLLAITLDPELRGDRENVRAVCG